MEIRGSAGILRVDLEKKALEKLLKKWGDEK